MSNRDRGLEVIVPPPPEGNNVSPDAAANREAARRLAKWQQQLLPLIVRMLVGLAAFFFIVSLVQMAYLAFRVDVGPKADIGASTAILVGLKSSSVNEAIEVSQALTAAALEVNVLERRYHQASVLLMARVWTIYLGFVTGMILALLGAAFTLGRIEGHETSLELKFENVGGGLKTSVAGIVLVAFGVILMVATLFARQEVTVNDGAVYTGAPSAGASGKTQTAPPLRTPNSTPSPTDKGKSPESTR